MSVEPLSTYTHVTPIHLYLILLGLGPPQPSLSCHSPSGFSTPSHPPPNCLGVYSSFDPEGF